MTLTVCLQSREGLVLVSDSRGTFGYPRAVTTQNDTMKKIHVIGNIGIAVAGLHHFNMIIE